MKIYLRTEFDYTLFIIQFTMLDNTTYNIMRQIVEEHTSLWRITNEYLADAEGDEGLLATWKTMAEEKENDITKLIAELKERI